MVGTQLDRAIGLLELLAGQGAGLSLGEIADRLGLPKSGAHRLLAELGRLGLVRQDGTGRYGLTLMLVSLAFRHLAASGIVDAAQPILDALAREAGELVRLSVTNGERQVWVAKAQGARSGLIFDPQMGDAAHLSAMATGLAWLARLDDATALRLATAEGFAPPDVFGPRAPRTVADFLGRLEQTRRCGYAIALDSSAPGMSAIAAAVMHPCRHAVLGTVSIGGPSARLTEARLEALVPGLIAAATELSACCAGSAYLASGMAASA
jgi:IclR family transcriptional regulator, acetate operon repressor